MTFSHIICTLEWCVDSPGLWAGNIGNSWRTTTDISDYWYSMLNNIEIVRLSNDFIICLYYLSYSE